MFWTIAKKEFLVNMTSYKAAIALLLCLTLFPISFFLLIADYQWRVDVYSKELKRGAPWGMTTQIFRYPPPSSLFAKGIDISRSEYLPPFARLFVHLRRHQSGGNKCFRQNPI